MSLFVDEVEIRVEAGRGGDGCVAFRREKYVPRGGPAGGDGGDGGSVRVVAHERLRTLLDLRPVRVVRASAGEAGRGKQQCGARGEDREVKVPVGTLVFDRDTGECLADLVSPAAQVVVARGGRGGRGNVHFTTPTHRAPREAEPGQPGQARELRLELRLMAEVGLLGFPNVGKSTFIRQVSKATPKVGSYPFTTRAPHLGVAELPDHRTLVLADLPGLIEGAAQGAGLGHRFLRHLARTQVLLHVLDPADAAHGEPLDAYDALNRELQACGEHLADLPQVVVVNKIDLPEVRAQLASLKAAFAARKVTLHSVSAATGEGIPALLEILYRSVHPAP